MDFPRYIKHQNIDFAKWDACIDASPNREIYAYSWYLELTSENFDGIVLSDYEAVMPIVRKRKYGIKHVYQPLFTQKLGIFSCLKLSPDIVSEFFKVLKRKFIKINLNINQTFVPSFGTLTEHPNYVLNLNKTYLDLIKKFDSNTLRNIRKAADEGFQLTDGLNPELISDFKLKHMTTKLTGYQQFRLKSLIRRLSEIGHGKTYGVFNESNDLILSYFMPEIRGRIYYMISAVNDEGKLRRAGFFALNEIIKRYAGTDYMLDFEGSRIPGIARFFAGWGAVNEPYFSVKY